MEKSPLDPLKLPLLSVPATCQISKVENPKESEMTCQGGCALVLLNGSVMYETDDIICP